MDRCISCRFLLTRNQIPMKHHCKIRFVWMHYWDSDCVWTSVVVNHASEGTNQFPENYNLPLMSTAVISLHILSDLKDPFLSSQLNMFNTWIQSTYAVILRVVGMNCTRDGASEKRDVLNHRIRPLILIVSNCCCHDRSISEPAAIKIIRLQARARMSVTVLACCRPLLYGLYNGWFWYQEHR